MQLATLANKSTPRAYRRIILAMAFSARLLAADTAVFVTEHGKTFHARATCMALSHTAKPLQTTDAQARSHGLKECRICFRPAAAGKKKASNADWAKGGK